MLKISKSFLGVFLVVVMVFVLFSNTSVNAQTVEQVKVDSFASNVQYCGRGKDMPSQLSKDLKDMNITVNDNTLVEYVSTKKNDKADVMVVTNVSGSRMEKAFITSVTAEGQQRSYGESNDGAAWPDTPLGDGFTLLMMVEYNKFATNILQEYYYQPVNALFIYYENSNTYTVSSIEVDYQCGGYEYAIVRDNSGAVVGYTPLTDKWQQYTHNIVVSVSAPRKNTYYGGNNPYNTNRAIDSNRGSDASHALFYEADLIRKSDGRLIHLETGIGIDQLW